MKKRLNSAVIHVHVPTGDLTYATDPSIAPASDPLALAAWLEDVAGKIRKTAKRILRADTGAGGQ